MHRAHRSPNAKLTSALSSRYAKSLKRVLSRETKLSLYSSDSYPIHYTAGYPIYYANEYIRRATTLPRVSADNFILARKFRRGADIALFLHSLIAAHVLDTDAYGSRGANGIANDLT